MAVGNNQINKRENERFRGITHIASLTDIFTDSDDDIVRKIYGRKDDIACARDFAKFVIHGYIGSNVRGGYVREGALYVPGERGAVLLRDSHILSSAEELRKALNAHRNWREVHINKKIANDYLERAKSESDDFAFLMTDLSDIPTKRFGSDCRTVWLFGEDADKYGTFLYENNIKEMKLLFHGPDYVARHVRPYVKQLGIHLNNEGSSSIISNLIDLHIMYSSFFVIDTD